MSINRWIFLSFTVAMLTVGCGRLRSQEFCDTVAVGQCEEKGCETLTAKRLDATNNCWFPEAPVACRGRATDDGVCAQALACHEDPDGNTWEYYACGYGPDWPIVSCPAFVSDCP